jgi:hypothetical protein
MSVFWGLEKNWGIAVASRYKDVMLSSSEKGRTTPDSKNQRDSVRAVIATSTEDRPISGGQIAKQLGRDSHSVICNLCALFAMAEVHRRKIKGVYCYWYANKAKDSSAEYP